MGPEVVNRNKNCVFNGPYAGRDLYIAMYQDSEREFVVTHNAGIKPVSYFIGREVELQDLRQRIEAGRKSVLVSGMGGIGKTHICRKLFEEYLNKHAKDGNGPFRHIGYIEYSGDMGGSLQNCLKFRQQDDPEQNREAAWRELEYLAADGKLLLFVDNVDKPINADLGLQRLKGIPGAVVLTSRRTSFSKEFEPYRIGFLDIAQCKEIYEKIRFEDSGIRIKEEEVPDLEYIIEELSAKHTITVEHLAHLARANGWSVKKLREQLEKKGFQLEYVDDEEKLINIQESYEILYDMSELTEAEQNILEAFSVFPYIPLEKEICNQWLLADAEVSEEENVFFEVYRKGWLQFDIEQDSYALHPVFAQVIYEKCKPDTKNHLKLIQSCKKSIGILKTKISYGCLKYVLLVENVIQNINMGNSREQIQLINELASVWLWFEIYEKAKILYIKVLENRKEELGENHLDVAMSYENLAYVYGCQEEYEDAVKLYKRSLRILENVLGENHLETARCYCNLAYMFSIKQEYETALEFFMKAYRVFVLELGLGDKETKKIYDSMVFAYLQRDTFVNFIKWLDKKMKE